MAQAGTRVDEVVTCAGMSDGVVLDRLIAAISSSGDYHTVQVGPDRLQFARTFRPTWAIVAGCATIWIALIGVLFFFVKTTETCLAVIESDHRGVRVRLSGRLGSDALGRVRSALAPHGAPVHAPGGVGMPVGSAFDVAQTPPPPAPPTASGGPVFTPSPVPIQSPAPIHTPPPPPPLPVPTPGLPGNAPPSPASLRPPASPVAPVSPSVGLFGAGAAPVDIPSPPLTGGPVGSFEVQPGQDPNATVIVRRADGSLPPTAPAAVVMDDGTEHPLGALMVFGRDPAAGPDEPGAVLVPVVDDTRSVSKTHFSLTHDDGRVWVMDRRSTNGVEVVAPDGSRIAVPPGENVPLPEDSSIRFGDRRCTVRLGHAAGAT